MFALPTAVDMAAAATCDPRSEGRASRLTGTTDRVSVSWPAPIEVKLVTRHPVFFDPTKRRSVILGHLGWIVSVVSTIVLVLFVASLLILPAVSVLPLDPPHKRTALTAANDIAQRRELLPAARRLADAARTTDSGCRSGSGRRCRKRRPGSSWRRAGVPTAGRWRSAST